MIFGVRNQDNFKKLTNRLPRHSSSQRRFKVDLDTIFLCFSSKNHSIGRFEEIGKLRRIELYSVLYMSKGIGNKKESRQFQRSFQLT